MIHLLLASVVLATVFLGGSYTRSTTLKSETVTPPPHTGTVAEEEAPVSTLVSSTNSVTKHDASSLFSSTNSVRKPAVSLSSSTNSVTKHDDSSLFSSTNSVSTPAVSLSSSTNSVTKHDAPSLFTSTNSVSKPAVSLSSSTNSVTKPAASSMSSSTNSVTKHDVSSLSSSTNSVSKPVVPSLSSSTNSVTKHDASSLSSLTNSVTKPSRKSPSSRGISHSPEQRPAATASVRHSRRSSWTFSSPQSTPSQASPQDGGDAMLAAALNNETEPTSWRVAGTLPTSISPCMASLCAEAPGLLVLDTSFCPEQPFWIGFGASASVRVWVSGEEARSQVLCGGWIQAPPQYDTTLTFQRLSSASSDVVVNVSVEIGEGEYVQNVTTPALLARDVIVTLRTSSVRLLVRSRAPHSGSALTFTLVARRHVLPSRRVSSTVTTVFSPTAWDVHGRFSPYSYDAQFRIETPPNHTVHILFNKLRLHPHPDAQCSSGDWLVVRELIAATKELPEGVGMEKKLCGFRRLDFLIIRDNPVLIHYHTEHTEKSIFKITYAVVPSHEEPARNAEGRYNCSVPHYGKFEGLFRCNLLRDCEGKEDETNCTYSGKGCGDGAFDAGSKCLTLTFPPESFTWIEAINHCHNNGHRLFQPRTFDIFQVMSVWVSEIFYNVLSFYIGVTLKPNAFTAPLSVLYRDVWRWEGGPSAFLPVDPLVYSLVKSRFPIICAFSVLSVPSTIYPHNCYSKTELRDMHIVCEFAKAGEDGAAAVAADVLGDLSLDAPPAEVFQPVSVNPCPLGHLTRDFLACDAQTHCGWEEQLTECPLGGGGGGGRGRGGGSGGDGDARSVAMFVCEGGAQSVPYSLVCDHVAHCDDQSDEDFCLFPPCPPSLFSCKNGQCVPHQYVCDNVLGCFDKSDEMCPPEHDAVTFDIDDFFTLPLLRVDFTSSGSYTLWPKRECEDSHFLCPGGRLCLPVYMRCNGHADCPSGEDEGGCAAFACPGFYRCRGTAMCLHPADVCNGFYQCPQFDDELLCEQRVCPDVCLCHGLAFTCTARFPAGDYPALRYLDVSGTSFSPRDIVGNTMQLIRLSLSQTGLSEMPFWALPNLRHLDLSHNRITAVNMQSFSFNVKVLVLAGNPLVAFVREDLSAWETGVVRNFRPFYGRPVDTDYSALQHIDASQTKLGVYNSTALAICVHLRFLNLSGSQLHTVTPEGFRFNAQLETLDVRGSPLMTFPKDLLRNLVGLKTVYADNFKLCCAAILPESFDPRSCFARQDLVTSCRDLLRSNTFRTFLWLFCLMAVAGNAGSLVARFYLKKPRARLGSFDIFVSHLCAADLCMGLYLALVGAADAVYRGHYVWHDDQWKTGPACSAAGFLCVLSSEVSAFLILLITLDRLLALRCPFSALRFTPRSALAACAVVWSAGLVLAAVPFLPAARHWRFYRQTGVCIPLPFNQDPDFAGLWYSLSLMLAVNFLLFLLIAAGQVAIFCTVRRASMPASSCSSSSSSSSSHSLAAREAALAKRLLAVALSDFLCWFPVGLLGTLALSGTPIPGEVNVGVAVFVLPFNSALNPFVYTLSVVREKYRLTARRGQEGSGSGSGSGGAGGGPGSCSRQALLDQLKALTASRALSVTDVLAAVTTTTSQDCAAPPQDVDAWLRSLQSSKVEVNQ